MLCAAVMLLLCGCAGADTGCAAFIKPDEFGGELLISGTPASAGLPVVEKHRRTLPTFDYAVLASSLGSGATSFSDSKTVYTSDMLWVSEDHYFVGEELSFRMPGVWNWEEFSLEIRTVDADGIDIRQFMFYYTEQSSGTKILAMKIDSLTDEYVEKYSAPYGEHLGMSMDGSHLYVRAAVMGVAPGSLQSPETYNELLRCLTAEDFRIQLNV